MDRQRFAPARGAALRLLAAAAGLALAGTAQAAEQTKALHQTFPAGTGEVRLANLAGKIELSPGSGREIVIDAVVHAEGSTASETQWLLQGMKWVASHDRKGRPEWALAYPVDKYRSYAYPRLKRDQASEALPSFLSFLDTGCSTSTYRGEKVRVYAQRKASAPVLYADLHVTMPAGANLVVRNVVGGVIGGAMDGTLGIDTGSGRVELAAHSGQLRIDTGSGDVVIGSVKGETGIDTGSGDVVVRRWVGNGKVDTGSGNVVVQQVSGGKIALDTGSGNVTVEGGVVGTILADTGSGNVKVMGVELEELEADTGSGDVTIQSPLAKARKISADTGSGDVVIHAGPDAAFDVRADQGSGDLIVGYADAVLRKDGRKVVGAKRGDGRTVILCETGSGDCEIRPNAL